MARDRTPTLSTHGPRSAWTDGLVVLVGALVGFGLGAAVYVAVNPVLEDSSGWIRELQGMLWNIVPLLTVLGALLGRRLARQRHEPSD